MTNIMGLALLSAMAALALGITLKNPKVKLQVYGGAVLIFLLYGWYTIGSFKPGVMNGAFFFVLFFLIPFSIGEMLGKRFGKKGKNE